MTGWHVRAVVLPDEVVRDLWFDRDCLRFDPLPGARTLHDGGYVIPGLVDVHTHPGTTEIGQPLDDAQLHADAAAHTASGTALIRVPGSASRLPSWFGEIPNHPRVVQAGLPVAAIGGFFPGWGRQVPISQVPQAAAEEADRTGWCKLIIDWFTQDGGYGATMPEQVVVEASQAVHEVGGRIAAHAQSSDGARAAVAARIDSIEHGMHLPKQVLDDMAETGIVLVPTATAFHALQAQMTGSQVPKLIRTWFTAGLERHARLTAAAAAAGVTVLAGTDLPPGSLTTEIRWLADAGLTAHEALGAGSWTARHWLGLPGLQDHAPADLLILDHDPRQDLTGLDRPRHVVVRGQVVR